jgi:prolyl-tRNA synthetase
METVATPGQHTIADVCRFLGTTPEHCIKTLLVEGRESEVVALVLRGDHELNAIKAEKHLAVQAPDLRIDAQVLKACGCRSARWALVACRFR